jgi:ribosome biogenesis protein MAK21
LKKQMKELGLTGKFPDEPDEGEKLESDWTDESQFKPSPPPKPEPKTKAKVEPPKPHTIDRPLQLSASSKLDSKTSTLSKSTKLKIEPNPIWYSIERPTSSGKPANAGIASHLHTRGKFLLQAEVEKYSNSSHISASDRQFLSTIMTSGTQSDKLSALTLSVSSSPIHHQKQLDALLNLAKKKSRNEAVQAVASIKDLLVGNLLPDDRKLMYFGKQGLNESPTDEELILYTFEDWLKGWYFQVLQIIEVPMLSDFGTDLRDCLWIHFPLFETI